MSIVWSQTAFSTYCLRSDPHFSMSFKDFISVCNVVVQCRAVAQPPAKLSHRVLYSTWPCSTTIHSRYRWWRERQRKADVATNTL